MARIDEAPVTTETNTTYETDTDRRRRGGWLWWLLALLLLLGLVFYFVTRPHDKDASGNKSSTSQSQSATNNSASSKDLKAKFEAAIPAEQRTILFNADTTDLQDQTATDAALTKIADFYKANKDVKLTVNGSIFNGQPGDKNEQLARQRAQIIQQQLEAKGVSADTIQVTAVNTYKGNTDAAQAEYARSVTIDAK